MAKGKILGKFLTIAMFCGAFSIADAKDMKVPRTSSPNLFYKTDSKIRLSFELSAADLKTFSRVTEQIEKKNWSNALSWANSLKNEEFRDAMSDYIWWKKYEAMGSGDGHEEFSDLIAFVNQNPFLPNIGMLRRKVENIYFEYNISYEFMEHYFSQNAPIQSRVKIRILEDRLDRIQRNIAPKDSMDRLTADIRNTWADGDFNRTERQRFLDLFLPFLREEDFVARIENLLWQKQNDEAIELFKYVNQSKVAAYSAAMRINENPKYINNILRTVPRSERNNEILMYSRLRYYHRNKEPKDAVKILYDFPIAKSKNPTEWWKYQKLYARELLKTNDGKKAYFVVSNHNLRPGTVDYADAEWLSGWIALRFVKKPDVAQYHFMNMYKRVGYPVSVSRAAYWAGRAFEEGKRKAEAIKWYEIASEFSLYFYGQLALHSYNRLTDGDALGRDFIPKMPDSTATEDNRALENRVVKLAHLLACCTNDLDGAKHLFKYAINTADSKGEVASIFEIAKNTENDRLIIDLAKIASYKHVFFVDNLFPVLTIVKPEDENCNLIHSIIKQESNFYVSARSPVGATGFMQLMPATAKDVCGRMKVPYDERKLRTDPVYNTKLGSYYLSMLLNQFDGAEVLAVASYNAGPGATNNWIKAFGDPRKMRDMDEIIDWIELITYAETRNYVQRILENSVVYEYIFSNGTFGK